VPRPIEFVRATARIAVPPVLYLLLAKVGKAEYKIVSGWLMDEVRNLGSSADVVLPEILELFVAPDRGELTES
jgi:hypothetical protein